MAEVGLQGNWRSPIGARLEGIEAEYKRVQEERDAAVAERDAAREALKPLLEQVDGLRALIVAQLPKADRRLPSAKTRLKEIPDTDVAAWIERNKAGESVFAIATSAKVSFESVRIRMIRAGHNPVMHQNEQKVAHRRNGHCQRKETCPGCGETLEPGEEGKCEACVEVDRVVEERRMAKAAAEADPTGMIVFNPPANNGHTA